MERFWSKVEKTDTCWIWTAAVRHPSRRDPRVGGRSLPHGQFRYQGRKVDAHRVAYMLSRGLPDLNFGLIAHVCDNPRCVRPDHLELSDPSRNLQDAWARRRREHLNLAALCAWFEANPITLEAT